MRIMTIISIFGFFCCAINHQFGINRTSNPQLISAMAMILVGSSSSKYYKESFINYVIYGRYDDLFTYQELFYGFGVEANSTSEGSLIISKDFKLGGVVIWDDRVVIPIQGSIITQIPINQIDKFFPNGYIIKNSTGNYYLWGNGLENSTFNGDVVCTDCQNEYGFSENDLFYSENNRFWIKWGRMIGLDIFSFGYLSNYEKTTGKGIINIYMYYANSSEFYNYSLMNNH